MGFLGKLWSLLSHPTAPEAPAAPEQAPAPEAPVPVPTQASAGIVPDTRVDRRKRARVDARRGTRVLIIDDSPTVLVTLRRHLNSIGLVVIEAADAETGLDLLRSHKPELIFLDIILPHMDGFAALRHIRRDPLGRTVPVVMMSGNELAAEQFYANRIGADDFMHKPFTRRDVFARIEPLLDERLVPRHSLRRPPAPTAAGATDGGRAHA